MRTENGQTFWLVCFSLIHGALWPFGAQSATKARLEAAKREAAAKAQHCEGQVKQCQTVSSEVFSLGLDTHRRSVVDFSVYRHNLDRILYGGSWLRGSLKRPSMRQDEV